MGKNSCGVGLNSGGALAIDFIVFKLARDAGWSWLRILAPLLVTIALAIVIYVIWAIVIKLRK